jgi:hypothetical protein
MLIPSDGNRRITQKGPKIHLRYEKTADGSQLDLWVYFDTEGWLNFNGLDLGPITGPVSAGGEYEYFKSVAANDIPRLVKLLGGRPGTNILNLLKRKWTGERSHELEKILEESDIPVDFSDYSD